MDLVCCPCHRMHGEKLYDLFKTIVWKDPLVVRSKVGTLVCLWSVVGFLRCSCLLVAAVLIGLATSEALPFDGLSMQSNCLEGEHTVLTSCPQSLIHPWKVDQILPLSSPKAFNDYACLSATLPLLLNNNRSNTKRSVLHHGGWKKTMVW